MNRDKQIESIQRIAVVENATIENYGDTTVKLYVDAENAKTLLYRLNKAGWDTKHQHSPMYDHIEVHVRLNPEPVVDLMETNTPVGSTLTAKLSPPPAPSVVPLHTMEYGITVKGLDYAFAAFLYLPDAFVLFRHLQLITPAAGTVYSLVNLKTGSVIASTDDSR